jgi:hypothetical protein
MRKLQSDYNPLKNIFEVLNDPPMTSLKRFFILKELILGGILLNTKQEFNQALELLVDINPRKHEHKDT